jgi:hypothetical protein
MLCDSAKEEVQTLSISVSQLQSYRHKYGWRACGGRDAAGVIATELRIKHWSVQPLPEPRHIGYVGDEWSDNSAWLLKCHACVRECAKKVRMLRKTGALVKRRKPPFSAGLIQPPNQVRPAHLLPKIC